MWVKICGTTSEADARMAAEAGADAVGFVFAAGSRRRVTVEAVRAMSRMLADGFPAVERVGVFEVVDAGQVVEAARAAGLTGVQLHGGGGVALAQAVRALAPELTVMAVVSFEVGAEFGPDDAAARAGAMMRAFADAGVERVLLDSKVGAARGGTGVTFAWGTAAAVLSGLRDGVKLVVAGGLRPATVAEAIRLLRPWGVDVVSGVEAEAGRKSEAAVRAFVRAARG